ncbi:uncharacterized protein K452DRAFT_360765 [Aplosporella prunicola CBS 121167]|uniref:Uncharacterized protein n=1 Tax=Aplosporella prunicola CBS 121167 TaxID=1176127 RepID=A0A6A6B5X6_9PEZI|nr:uncharacterized protein K452DRAFT_360765 [Aplosporella prunicola CBS 121167]KAF2139028.1 hypothetical protein K452DRAFT_360765 [Aplosporella prunicola CBS 121167]
MATAHLAEDSALLTRAESGHLPMGALNHHMSGDDPQKSNVELKPPKDRKKPTSMFPKDTKVTYGVTENKKLVSRVFIVVKVEYDENIKEHKHQLKLDSNNKDEPLFENGRWFTESELEVE